MQPRRTVVTTYSNMQPYLGTSLSHYYIRRIESLRLLYYEIYYENYKNGKSKRCTYNRIDYMHAWRCEMAS